MNGNDIVADFIKNISWTDLPADVQTKAKVCLLDALGAIIVGNPAVITGISEKYAARMWPGQDEATMLVSGLRSSATGAAFVNACAANALDIDDDGKYTEGHPGAQIIPVALAMAEKQGVTGQEALTAIVIGYEVAHRMGRCWHDDHEIYQACGSWGSVANAAIASRLLGLDKEKTKHALGIADYFAPNLPMMRDIDHPTMVKHGMGWGAMTGIMSAELASDGFTGIPSLLGSEKYKDWVSTIGTEYIIVDGVTFKRFSSCLWGHPTFLAAQKLVEKHHITPSNIERINVKGFHEMIRLYDKHPETEEQAQFSVIWPLAAFIADGEVGPAQMLKKRFDDPIITDLVRRIELVETKKMNQLHESTIYPCEVEITLKDTGVTHSSGVQLYSNSDITGEFGDMWEPSDVKAKFIKICQTVIDDATIEKCISLVESLDTLQDINPLIQLLNGKSSS
jgi:2-methylcitrate dehydratase PrpD